MNRSDLGRARISIVNPPADRDAASPAAAVPPSERLSFEEELGDLPRGYGDGRLICMVRDTGTLFVYWDLSQQQIEQAFGGLGNAQARLKLWALRGELAREVPVNLESRGCVLRDLPAGSHFRLE